MHLFLMQLDMPGWVGTRKKKEGPFLWGEGDRELGEGEEWDIESDWEEREGL